MLTLNDIQPEALQASAFVKDQELGPTRILRRVLRDWGDIYDGEPVVLPSLEAFPPDVASVILTSRDERHRIEVARTRINLFRIRVDEPPLDLGGIGAKLAGRLADIVEGEQALIGRLAAVATNFFDAEDAAKEIARHFFKDRWLEGSKAPLNRPQKLEVHSHKIFQLAVDLQVNSWVRVKSAQRIKDLSPVVVVEQDINTLEEDRLEREFSRAAVVAFYDRVAREFSTILGLYFPPHSGIEEG